MTQWDSGEFGSTDEIDSVDGIRQLGLTITWTADGPRHVRQLRWQHVCWQWAVGLWENMPMKLQQFWEQLSGVAVVSFMGKKVARTWDNGCSNCAGS